MIKPLLALSCTLLAMAACPTALASSITISSNTDTTDTFDLSAPDGNVSVTAGNTLSLTGFSGITDVSLSPNISSFGSVSWTDTSILFTVNQTTNYADSSPIDFSLFTVTSSTTPETDLDYTFQQTSETDTGSLATPDAPTPEPSALLLLATGAVVGGIKKFRPHVAVA